MNRYPKNREALASRHPELAAALDGTDAAALDLLKARSGKPSARLPGGAYLHSRYDPEAEAAKACEEALAAGADLIVVMGMGLGYAAEAALRAGVLVVVAEPDAAVAKACLCARDMGHFLAHERLFFCYPDGGPALGQLLEGLDARAVARVENSALAVAFPEPMSSIRSAYARFREKDRINAATLKRFGRRWVRNLAANLPYVSGAPGVSSLMGRFSGCPAIVLAAGPSLDELLPRLARLRERFVLVCVDTALRSALRAGVEPDFVVVVDPQFWNARHLDRCPSPRSVLVTEASVWPSVFRNPFRAVFACSSIYPLGRYIEARSGPPRGQLGAGGSVATTAWDFARALGCSPVFMAGLDLSFPDGKTHARASLFEQRSLNAGSRLRPSASDGFEAMRGGQPYAARANDGSLVVTDRRLALYSWWFSSRAARHPETPSYNLSARGLAIDGLMPADAGSLEAFPPIRGRIDGAMAECVSGAARAAAAGSVGPVIETLLVELERIATTAERALEDVARARTSSGLALEGALGRLAEADESILASGARDVVGFLFGSAEELLEGRSRTLSDSLDKTERVYRGIAESARWHARVLGGAVAGGVPGEMRVPG